MSDTTQKLVNVAVISETWQSGIKWLRYYLGPRLQFTNLPTSSVTDVDGTKYFVITDENKHNIKSMEFAYYLVDPSYESLMDIARTRCVRWRYN